MKDLLPCSNHAQTVGEDPVGSAGTYQEYFLLEMPLPWAPDPWESKDTPDGLRDHFKDLEMAGRAFRAMAIAPEEDAVDDGFRTFIHYRLNQADGPEFERRSYRIPVDAILETVIQLTTAEETEEHPYQQDLSLDREFFVCTHGSRDQCCGTKGYPIFQAIKKAGFPVWRVSHTGGHRFAPTCIDFPTGHYWAWLTEERALQVAYKKGPHEELKLHYRGWSVLETLGQVIERALFLETGWNSWAQPRAVEGSLDDSRVSIRTPDAQYDFQISQRESIESRAKCSSDMIKAYPQYEVRSLSEEGQRE